MEPNVIFIELENPRDLIIAVKTDKDGYYRNYTLMDAEYGRDCIDYLKEGQKRADLFKTIEHHQLPSGITEQYEWPEYKPRFVTAYTHKI